MKSWDEQEFSVVIASCSHPEDITPYVCVLTWPMYIDLISGTTVYCSYVSTNNLSLTLSFMTLYSFFAYNSSLSFHVMCAVLHRTCYIG